MPTSVIEHIRRVVGDGLRDGELLGRFVDRRDEAALATLVNRHGPMVWGVCRRLLNHHDAEDAFQATFIVLGKKASAIAHREMLGNWLHGVAHQAALQARRTIARRRAREVQVMEMPDTAAAQNDQWPDVRPLLDEELSRLPDHYRAVIVLCDLEGKTRKEVAVQLGCPEGTVASRLVRARSMLAKRLTQRGVALSGGVLAAVLSKNAASGGVPASVVSSTIKAASFCGQAVSLKVAALAEGVLKTMLLTKLKPALAALVVVAMVGLIGYGMAGGQQKGDPAQKQASEKAEDAVKEKAEKEDAIAWGTEVDGLQAGLVAEAATCRPGDKLKFTVKLRNVGKADAKVTHGLLKEFPPEVMTADGGKVSVFMPIPKRYKVRVTELTIKPGETITLYEPEVAVEPEALMRLEGIMRVDTPTICVDPGKYKIACGGMIQSHPKLTTGTVEFEVKPASVTAWGKEVGGLQAGLTVAENRAYHTGETVELVVRVRNVGKEPVKFQYIPKFFVENAPTVTDGDGKQVHFRYGFIELTEGHSKVDVSLAPGKEIQLAEVKLPMTLLGTGKFNLQYERVFSNTWGATITLDPALTKLATGKLELEVKDAEDKKPVEPAAKQQKEAFTEWGKEVGGLQAGLGYKVGEKRTYTHGETVTLVVRVRNVGKEAVKFQYLRQFFIETPPTVTTGDGKPIPVPIGRLTAFGIHLPVEVNLAPEKEIELYEWKPRLRSEGDEEMPNIGTLYGTGKFQVQYERVFGNSSSGSIKIDLALSKLATGKLELEVTSDPPERK